MEWVKEWDCWCLLYSEKWHGQDRILLDRQYRSTSDSTWSMSKRGMRWIVWWGNETSIHTLFSRSASARWCAPWSVIWFALRLKLISVCRKARRDLSNDRRRNNLPYSFSAQRRNIQLHGHRCDSLPDKGLRSSIRNRHFDWMAKKPAFYLILLQKVGQIFRSLIANVIFCEIQRRECLLLSNGLINRGGSRRNQSLTWFCSRALARW